ncbi:MAG TPA: hypothetical protein VN323_22350 [Candidatus Dormibacteraeota bacterium]|jgi:hypothetical protein|nr:hypothetical protein [Candidatus Dormibacteraeota bacterium]
MYHPTIFLDPQFTSGVMAGWILTFVGVGALLLAALWFSCAGEWRGSSTGRPAAFRALVGLGILCWAGGLLWQFVGYFKTGTLGW